MLVKEQLPSQPTLENLVILNLTFLEVIPRHKDHPGLVTEKTKTHLQGISVVIPTPMTVIVTVVVMVPVDPVLPVVPVGLQVEELIIQKSLHNKLLHCSKALDDHWILSVRS